MGRPEKQSTDSNDNVSSSSSKFRGVRKRNWGKWVSEIRLPNSRERIWLGSFDSPEKAARAFDAALFCLRGRNAKFNFPDNPPDIVDGGSLSHDQIKVVAARFANAETRVSESGPEIVPDPSTSLSSSYSFNAESPSQSISDGPGHQFESEMTRTTFGDDGFLQRFFVSSSLNAPSENNVTELGYFSEFDHFCNDNYFPRPLPGTYDHIEDQYAEYTSQESFLWNF
ncbi:unnamed protein product [Cuscuta epithymum]|uniref:AP2/ERF domain-containing protein n=1 Tax=Cuscuta epithymum TaxID=186058 RepID=A0AAV0DBM4_9ASTE|nr:unnamed protein product [Cuscuta epithymum]